MKKLLLLLVIAGSIFVVVKYGNIDTKALKHDTGKLLQKTTSKVEKSVKVALNKIKD